MPFECDISTEKNIKKDDPRFGEKVIDWITECDRSSTSSTTVFVLKYVEDDNIYNYLVYRRGVECAFNTYIETLKNSLKEFLNLSFADKTVQEDYESESLTYIRYVGQREPELNIFSFTEDGSENLGYVIRTVYYEFMK